MSKTFEEFCAASKLELDTLTNTGVPRIVGLARRATASWHPNGFIVFDLGLHSFGSLRLHIWPTGIRQMRDDAAHIHTHVWDLYAKVLSGVYREQLYELTAVGFGARYRSAEIEYQRDRNMLAESGDAFLQPKSLIVVRAGGRIQWSPVGLTKH